MLSSVTQAKGQLHQQAKLQEMDQDEVELSSILRPQTNSSPILDALHKARRSAAGSPSNRTPRNNPTQPHPDQPTTRRNNLIKLNKQKLHTQPPSGSESQQKSGLSRSELVRLVAACCLCCFVELSTGLSTGCGYVGAEWPWGLA